MLQLAPKMELLHQELRDSVSEEIVFYELDVDAVTGAQTQFNLKVMPTIVCFGAGIFFCSAPCGFLSGCQQKL